MANTIKLRRSASQGAVPTTAQLALGEIAMNTYDGKLFIKKDDGTESIVEIGAGGGSTVTIANTPPAGAAVGDIYWDEDDGAAYIYYNDGNSSQWVALTPNNANLLDNIDYGLITGSVTGTTDYGSV